MTPAAVDVSAGGVLPIVPPDRLDPARTEGNTMKGYVAQRRGRYYPVIYEGLDPVTGREQRPWHRGGTDRADAERLAIELAAKETRRADVFRSLTFGASLTDQWLPGKQLHLATSTYRGYERNVHRHILPTLGRIGLRRLHYEHIEALYDTLLHPSVGRGLAPRPCTRSTSSSEAPSPTPPGVAWSPATSPSSPGLPDNGPSNAPKASH
jgi:hypothetical protein